MYNIPFKQINKDEFLAQYWQKKPCLFQNAFQSPPDFLTGDELAGFALDDEIESRLIEQLPENSAQTQKISWKLTHGPLDEAIFSQLTESHWTLLIQSIDTWAPQTRQLLQDFSFIPRWRFDDIMVSFATDQGGVGPHCDNYDVFLIQGSGKRHWRVGEKGDTRQSSQLINGMKHLSDFTPIIDYTMQPGDMLYIPPDTAHWGISIGESIGYSIGYRTLQKHQMLALLTENLAENNAKNKFFTDQYRNKPNNSNQFDPQMVSWAQQTLRTLANDPTLINSLLSKQLSHSKHGIFEHDNSIDIQSLNDDTEIQLEDEVNVNWTILDNKIQLNIEGESFNFPLTYEATIIKLASFQPIKLKLFNFSSNLVDFSPTLTNLLNRGHVKRLN